ncbi:hypothetical protein [Pontibacter beigongshangensis]|uniref:hypothetical protein n=1 Tax=Pontibacter beigongshangensis TaxID=2574733 RepID=UPI0016501D0B|nr:hypothetical protein [Pontibacter beigongshangensis]
MENRNNKTNQKAVGYIGLLFLILSGIVQGPLETVILLVAGSVLIGTGGYLWLQEFRRERELTKYANPA